MTGDVPPSGERRPGKFRNGIDFVLYQMGLDGWLTESAGEVEAPTGWFGWVVNKPEEMEELAEAMSDAIREGGITPAQLLGAWVVKEDQLGFVVAEEYDNEMEAQQAFNELDAAYDAWLEGQDNE